MSKKDTGSTMVASRSQQLQSSLYMDMVLFQIKILRIVRGPCAYIVLHLGLSSGFQTWRTKTELVGKR